MNTPVGDQPTGARVRRVTNMGSVLQQVLEARAQVEDALDAEGWPWSRRLSLWMDGLLVLEESLASGSCR